MVSQGFSTLLLAPRPGCWLSFSPPAPSFSFPQPVVCSATSSAPLSRPLGFLLPLLSLLVGGFCGFCGGVFRSSGSGASFLSWIRLSCLSPPMSFCCLRSSPDFWLFAVSSSFSCTLCVVLPAQASLLRPFLAPGSSGVALPSPTLFSCSRLFFLVASWSLLLPPLTTQFSVALAALLGSVYPVHYSLLALFARPLLPFLFFLGFCSMGLLLLGPLLGLCRGPSQLLGGSLFPAFGVSPACGFASSAATLLHPALLVAVASLCFFLCCWSACPTGGGSGLRLLTVCGVCCSSFLVCRSTLLFSVVCRLVWLGLPPALT